ncbi:cholesterol oxidase [Podospora fimiseda]|uniref:Cholesterol oxidase n=1 Tax=Podospora fimiseda TaxID=252190 RepID=A0AAN7H6J1_9PEZI|nr:cholesterol oxidase [Podospora fimiseda]
MDPKKPEAPNLTSLLQVHGVLSPPLTPALTQDGSGILDGQVNGTTNNINLTETQATMNHRRPRTSDSSSSSSTDATSTSSFIQAPRPISTLSGTTLTSEGKSFGLSLQREISEPFLDSPAVAQRKEPAPQNQPKTKPRTYTDGRNDRAFPRISKPVEILRSSYDVVVIGSGYGGGVAASRMARTGQSVCLLECGREKWPGEYPTEAVETLKELHCSGQFAPQWLKGKGIETGDPTGMYHVIFGKGQNAVVGNGLGGTSLINANVFMEADKETLSLKAWPREIRENPECLDEYYKKAADVLEPQEYPAEWPELPKTKLLKKQAENLGLGTKFKRVKQTTRFVNGPNSCGVEMSPSTLTGQDATGINDGSKTTTLVTYLADAWNWGAEMFCQCEVRYIKKVEKGEGYHVFFAWHGRNRNIFKANLHGDLMWVHAKKAVFLGAGAIASTEILLRSKAMGLDISDRVGKNMSGNGDMLAFGYNTDEPANSMGRPVPSPYNPIGPCITGVIDCREGHQNPLDGFVVEEGTVPQALAQMLRVVIDHMPGKKPPQNDSVIQQAQEAFARYGSKIAGPYFQKGALEKTQIYLIMSHDSNQARLTLKDDKPVLEFLGVARSNHAKKLNSLLERATHSVGGTLVPNPFESIMGQAITVHPIGGASMARDGTGKTGVTNHVGQVFIGNTAETYDGLIVTDASVIPTALGANPFATITALAERSVEAYCRSKSLVINAQPSTYLDLFGEPQHSPKKRRPKKKREQIRSALEQDSISTTKQIIQTARGMGASGIGFTEVMSGFIHHNPSLIEDTKETYELAHRVAKSLCESARFFLSVQAFNTKEMVNHSQHRGLLTGTFVCPTIVGSPFMVQRGEFNLFIINNRAPGTRNLTYDFDMTGVNGRKLHFHGYKVVDSSVALAPFQFWKATSTLYVTISERGDKKLDLDDEDAWREGKPIAKGIMNIQPADFISQINTMTTTGSGLLKRAVSAGLFLTYFTRKSLSLLLAPLAPLQYPTQTFSGFVNNDSKANYSPEIVAEDGVKSRLHIWEPTNIPHVSSGNVKNLFMIPGASVDHQIFALPTIPFNAVDYFRRAGYRVFVSVHRIGQTMIPGNLWTTFDARLDLKACLEYIRKHYSADKQNPEKIYTIAHCMGSVAFSCGLLDGTIPASWILGITCSQVFFNPIWGPTNMAKVILKAGCLPIDKLYGFVAGSWFSCSTSRKDTYLQQFLNQALRLYPQSCKEMCNNAACHRTSLVFGRCWNHRNLNEATHRQIDRFFGGVNMKMLNLLMRMGSEGHVMTNGPLFDRLDTRQNIQRLKGIPILLWVGRDNAVLSPEATERTYETLCEMFENGDYKRKVVPGYGHLDGWMGRNAWKDVYPFIREEVDRVVRGPDYQFVEPDDQFKRMRHGDELYVLDESSGKKCRHREDNRD